MSARTAACPSAGLASAFFSAGAGAAAFFAVAFGVTWAVSPFAGVVPLAGVAPEALSASAVAASVAALALSVAAAAARALSATRAGAVTCSVVDSTARGRRNIIQLAARSTVAARAMSMGRETWATFPRSAVGPED